MAIAPVNRFVNISVPVAPGAQKLYEVPTGASSLVLFAQVANVAIGDTFPTVTFWTRRTQRSTKSTSDNRIIKDGEIPPNDALIMVDGRVVLEKTPIVIDSLYIQGTQQNVGIITDVQYDEPSGIATVTTLAKHNLSSGDPITMGGIYFTCPTYSGITTNIFPDPQRSYVVSEVLDDNALGTSKKFTMDIGGANGNPHVYQVAQHRFVRAKRDAIEVVSSVNVPIGTKFNVNDATYNGLTGELVVDIGPNSLSTTDTIKILDETLVFTCTMDNHYSEHPYPRATDPVGGGTAIPLAIAVANKSFTVNVGKSYSGGFVAPLEMELTLSILENSNV